MIYLIDSIGKEAGMHLYNNAFINKVLVSDLKVKVLSNYEAPNTYKLLYNFYNGNIIKKIFLLLKSFYNVLLFYLKNSNNVFVYHSYGLRLIDIIFINIFILSKSFYVIVHDVFELTPNNKADSKTILKTKIYKTIIRNIICHSDRTKKELLNLGFKGNVLLFPHLNFNFNKGVYTEKLKLDVHNAIRSKKINILLFGQISLTKGIDILLDSFNFIKPSSADNINIIIAGVDKANLISPKSLPDYVTKICRYIDDNELNYLFSQSDYILLPYKEIYQSGVLDVAIYFEKPVILSDLEYFINFSSKYPSFCTLISPLSSKNLAGIINEIANNQIKKDFYVKEDLRKYIDDHDMANLLIQMKNTLIKYGLSDRLTN